jgi:hydroxyacylglutathione hydrolase
MKRTIKICLLGKLPSPKPLKASSLKKLASEKALFLDTRPWAQFRESHIAGALWAPLSNYFPNAAGSYIEPGAPFYLIVAENRLKEAVTDLIRIGLDDVAGYATPETFTKYQAEGGPLAQIASMPIAKLSSNDGGKNALLLDVRGAAEFEVGHLRNASNIAYTHLLKRLAELPKERPILVHCRTDNRSGIAAALLQRQGYNVIHLGGGYVAWPPAQGVLIQ